MGRDLKLGAPSCCMIRLATFPRSTISHFDKKVESIHSFAHHWSIDERHDELMQHIPVNQVSKTLQDAISVTRALGYRYLWVDALCNLQDSDTDKAVEIAKMPAIYSEASFTISTEECFDSTQGCLEPGWNTTVSNYCQARSVPYKHPDGTCGFLDLIETLYFTVLVPIYTRAWTFQEHFLSKRILYFGGVLHWKCLGGEVNNSAV